MYLLFLSFVLLALGAVWGHKSRHSDAVSGLLTALILVCVVDFLIECASWKRAYGLSELTGRYEIAAMKDNLTQNGSLHGTFFLGCGSITGSSQTELAYFFYTKNGNALKYWQIPASAALLIEEDREDAFLEEYCFYNEYRHRFADEWKKRWSVGPGRSPSRFAARAAYKIVVPRGTVTRALSIDLE